MEGEGQTPTGNEHPTTPWSGAEGLYKIGEGDKAVPWWSGIQEEPIRNYMETKQYANPYEAARAAWNANKLLANQQDAVVIPGESSTPEDWNALYTKLGRPEAADKYDFKLPQGVEVSDDVLKQANPVLQQVMFELGATPAKAQAAYEKLVAMDMAIAEQNAATEQAALDALTAKWEGEGKLKEMQAAGQRAMQALGLSQETVTAIEASIGSAPIVELLAVLGSKSGEGTFVSSGSNGGDPNDPSNMSADQARKAIANLESDKAFQDAYTNRNATGHLDAVKRMEALFKKATS